MLDNFYPRDQRAIFTNRTRELALLEQFQTRIDRGEPQRLAIWGQRRIGKTLLLREFCARLLEQNWPGLLAYVDLELITSSPENFTLGYIGHILHWHRTRWRELPPDLFSLTTLDQMALAGDERAVREAVSALHQHFAQEKPNRHALLTLAFNLPDRLSKELGQPAIVILDEFPELLSLERYEGIRVLPLFRGLMQQSPVSYILAGSAVAAMQWMTDDHESPLFAQLDRLSLGPFPPEDTRALVYKLMPDLSDPSIPDEIARLSGGYPYYIRCLVRGLENILHLHQISPSPDAVRHAFLLESLSPEGCIYTFCQYIFDTSLQKAVGYGPLKAVMQLLAEGEERPARLARRLKVSQPAIWGYLRRLEEVGLVVKNNGAYRYRDPVLQFWVAAATRGVQVGPHPRRQDLAGLVHLLEERFQRTASELGLAKEFEVRELLRRLAGQPVAGELLGTTGSLTLPAFSSVEPWRSPDGQVEIDAVASDGETWLVELKWQVRPASVRDVRRFLGKAQALPHQRLWFISRSGVSAAAQRLAQQHGVLLSDGSDLRQLSRLAGLRFS